MPAKKTLTPKPASTSSDTVKPPAKKASSRNAAKKAVSAPSPRSRAFPAGVARAATPAKEPLVLVCLQDPFSNGTWILHQDGTVPCADGKDNHLWRLRVGFELVQPRMLEGQYSSQPVTMAIKGFAVAGPADNANWTTSARLETGTTPPLRVVVRVTSAGKIEFSLAFGAKHPEGIALPFKSESRPLEMDVAFATNGPNGLSVAAVGVIATLPWVPLIAGSDAAVKGLGFDSSWMKNLQKASTVKDKKGRITEKVADGATIAQGTWGFAAMTRTEYLAWCNAHGRMPSEYLA